MATNTDRYTNRLESRNFLRSALMWNGSVSPRIFRRALWAIIYSVLIKILFLIEPSVGVEIGPFEYSGVVLGMLLVFRVNAGHDRWWEARKIWGNIVNQSRNLAQEGFVYCTAGPEWKRPFLRWVAAFPHVMRASLRGERDMKVLEPLVGVEEASRVAAAGHMPSYVSIRIAELLKQASEAGQLSGFEYMQVEGERSELIDAIGACERILRTPMPLILAIKVRRFILIFLALLPFALAEQVGLLTPVVMGLVAYPLFSLDQIGVELQNPFMKEHLSHLPLHDICMTIESNVLEVESPTLETSALAIARAKSTGLNYPLPGTVPKR